MILKDIQINIIFLNSNKSIWQQKHSDQTISHCLANNFPFQFLILLSMWEILEMDKNIQEWNQCNTWNDGAAPNWYVYQLPIFK